MPSDTEGQARYLINRRIKAKNHLGGCCVSCGATDDLHFDHVDPNDKATEISNAIAKHWSWARLVPELQKCQLLCGVCHRAKTSVEQSVEHGAGASGRKNCPCVPCKARKAEYMKNYHARVAKR